MAAKAPRKPALGFVFVTLVLVVLGYGLIIPVLPGLITEFQGGSTSDASHVYGWLVGVFALMQFVSSPILGALSDRFGRRKVILIALAGSAADYLLMAWAPTLGWLFVARIIAGLTSGTVATVNAYVVDVTPPEKRAQGFGLLGAAVGLGFVIGPAIGGLLGGVNLRAPFIAAAACTALNLIYGAMVLPESLPVARRKKFDWKQANPAGALLALRKFPVVLGLAGTHLFSMLGTTMLQSVWVLYTGYRYDWKPAQVGISLAVVGIAGAVVQGALVRVVIARIGERRALVAGLLIMIVAMIAYGSATQGWMIYGLVFFGSLGGIAGPAAQALITQNVPDNEQGRVQGSLSSLTSLAGVVAPPVAAWSFGVCIAPGAAWHIPGIAFFEAAALTLIALILALRSFGRERLVGAKAN